jgi:hypothetical protein
MTNHSTQAGVKYPKPAGTRLFLLWLLSSIAIASAWLAQAPFAGN